MARAVARRPVQPLPLGKTGLEIVLCGRTGLLGTSSSVPLALLIRSGRDPLHRPKRLVLG